MKKIENKYVEGMVWYHRGWEEVGSDRRQRRRRFQTRPNQGLISQIVDGRGMVHCLLKETLWLISSLHSGGFLYWQGFFFTLFFLKKFLIRCFG